MTSKKSKKPQRKFVIQEYLQNQEYLEGNYNDLNLNPRVQPLIEDINRLVLVENPLLYEISLFYTNKKFTVPMAEEFVSNLEKFMIILMELSETAEKIFPDYKLTTFSKRSITKLIRKFDIVGEVTGSSSDDSSSVTLHYKHKKKVYYISEKELQRLLNTFRVLFPHSPDEDGKFPVYEQQAHDIFRYLQFITKNYKWNQIYPEKLILLEELAVLLKSFLQEFDVYLDMFQHDFYIDNIKSIIKYFRRNYIEWGYLPGRKFRLFNILDELKKDFRPMTKFFDGLKKAKVFNLD